MKVVLKDTPNVQIHPWAQHAAINANCLAAQSNQAYWDFTDYVHAHQAAITGDPSQVLDKLALEHGQKYNLHLRPLLECIHAQSAGDVEQSWSEATQQLGVRAVPTLFINGEKLRGARSAQQLREAVDRALGAVGESAPAQPSPGTMDKEPAAATAQPAPEQRNHCERRGGQILK